MAASSATAQQNKAAVAGGPFPIEQLQTSGIAAIHVKKLKDASFYTVESISGVAALDVKKLKGTGLDKVESVACTQRKDILQIKGISEVKVDKKVEPAPKLFGQKVDADKIPIYLITGSRIVDQILGRDVKKTQFSRTAFQTDGSSCHLLSCGYKDSGCRAHIAREVPKDKEEFVASRSLDLGEELEKMQYIYQQIMRKRQQNSRANVSHMWRLIDERVEKCRRIRQDIGAVGGACQDIPPYFIR